MEEVELLLSLPCIIRLAQCQLPASGSFSNNLNGKILLQLLLGILFMIIVIPSLSNSSFLKQAKGLGALETGTPCQAILLAKHSAP